MRKIRKSDLGDEHRKFVEDMQHLRFGRYENVLVRNGAPCLIPKPRRIRTIKIGSDDRAKVDSADFALKDILCAFFSRLEEIGNGTILVLEVKHGLPFLFEIE